MQWLVMVGRVCATPRVKQPVKQGEALREVDLRLHVVAQVVLRPQLDPQAAREPRGYPEVLAAVLDARVAVELLEEQDDLASDISSPGA
eukprot:CAMPEP_0195584246 /NCGR_PEP_ID=MMETSP0814-20130614/25571_1 /TAXON_ID=97485 /ORGANISM="Prymnesium parvum, Strain Texoma1" /LENGTH=88 /DNA_ID=CAMNT_0040722271 /DNA_START=296 /DNA_END=561 /DNA_ORIENTATION=+